VKRQKCYWSERFNQLYGGRRLLVVHKEAYYKGPQTSKVQSQQHFISQIKGYLTRSEHLNL